MLLHAQEGILKSLPVHSYLLILLEFVHPWMLAPVLWCFAPKGCTSGFWDYLLAHLIHTIYEQELHC